MPTRRSLEAGGYETTGATPGTRICYVCQQPVGGLAQRDEPTPEAGRKGVVLGDRHRDCEPSDDAGGSKKVYLVGTATVHAD